MTEIKPCEHCGEKMTAGRLCNECASTEVRLARSFGETAVRVLDEAGATDQELTRFAHLLKRSSAGAFVEITLIEGGALGVAEAIDSCTEIAKERGDYEKRR